MYKEVNPDVSNNGCPIGVVASSIYTLDPPVNPGNCPRCCTIQGTWSWQNITPSGACWNACSGASSGCPVTCNPSAWGNYQNWQQTFLSLPNFSSQNPNQPCNMLCNKIQTWENTCQTAGPNHQNSLACKIQFAQNQAQIHNCNC